MIKDDKRSLPFGKTLNSRKLSPEINIGILRLFKPWRFLKTSKVYPLRSISKSFSFLHSPPPYPVNFPSEPMTR